MPEILGIDELRKKYRISEDVLMDEVERTILSCLTKRLGCEVELQWDRKGRDEFRLYGFTEDDELINLTAYAIREIKWTIACNLLKRSILEKYEIFKHKEQSIAYGTIIKQGRGNLFVELQDIGDDVVAVCEPAAQTPAERKRRIAGVLPFYVLSIEPVSFNGIPRLEVRLSRNSKGLVEGLLREELEKKSLDIRVKCIKRIAGAFSEVRASEKIPRDTIKRVSDTGKQMNQSLTKVIG